MSGLVHPELLEDHELADLLHKGNFPGGLETWFAYCHEEYTIGKDTAHRRKTVEGILMSFQRQQLTDDQIIHLFQSAGYAIDLPKFFEHCRQQGKTETEIRQRYFLVGELKKFHYRKKAMEQDTVVANKETALA